MKKIIMIWITGMLYLPCALSQNAGDILRFSQHYAGGTARSLSMGGAFGALGGDMSSMSLNPAGIAIYRGAEFSFTPAMTFTSSDSRFVPNKTSFTESNARFNITNIGYVSTWTRHSEKGLQSVNFGMAYNRLKEFSYNAYVYTNVSSSMLNDFAWTANTGGWNDWYEQLAYDVFAIDDDPDYNDAYRNNLIADGDPFAEHPMKRTFGARGGIGEYDLSLGLNFDNKLYWGATMGIQSLWYEEFFTHSETIDKILNDFEFQSDYTTRGLGINLKTGLIYRPFNLLRLGVAIHTPTRYRLRSELTTDINAYYNQAPDISKPNTYYYTASSDIAEKKFKLVSPWRYNAGIAVVLGTVGLFSFDAEYVDYTHSELLPNADLHEENNLTKILYKSTINLKAGTEFRVGHVSLRGGVAHYASPYSSEYYERNEGLEKQGTLSISGGIGFRIQDFYVDVAYVHTIYPESYYDMYRDPDNPGYPNPSVNAPWISSQVQSTSRRIAVTLGFKF
ncbi:MAG: hypothetical protein LBS09_07640 [Bacteroidales bacterium]|jgi:hypothetical protein|nr:hypothetical protein [Bacteroidales bacterium]